MQNPLPFHTEYSPYQMENSFLPNGLDASIENDVFGPPQIPSMSANQIPPVSQPSSSGLSRSNKRKATIDTEGSFSPASIYSDNSSYSDVSYPALSRQSADLPQNVSSSRHNTITTASVLTTSAEEGSSDDDDDGDDLARKREKHTQVEAHRRALEKSHFRELSMLIASRNDTKSTKLHHLDLLKLAAELISEMNLRHKNDPLRPSNLTENESNFLTIEASNSFLFVTTTEPSSFHIIHVTDAIQRILNVTVDQWLGQNFLSFLHPDDLIRYRGQLMSLNQCIGASIHLECRLKQGNSDAYSSVIIDGMTKFIDHSLKPIPTNAPGYLAFVGICHLPLIAKYSQTNMCIHKNPQLCTFRCRCSPNDWKIFLVDRSVSTLPSISYDLFRQKSILDYISVNEQSHVHQALLRSTTTSASEMITCHFIHPNLHTSIPMNLEIKSFFNSITHRADFIELTFKSLANPIDTKYEASLLEFMNDTKEIDKLFESDPSMTNQPLIGDHINNNPTTQNIPYYYPNGWATKSELI